MFSGARHEQHEPDHCPEEHGCTGDGHTHDATTASGRISGSLTAFGFLVGDQWYPLLLPSPDLRQRCWAGDARIESALPLRHRYLPQKHRASPLVRQVPERLSEHPCASALPSPAYADPF